MASKVQRTKKNRYCRFGDASDEPEIYRSKNVNDLKSFYRGSQVDERMDVIRKSIVHIRQNWEQYESFLSSLKKLMAENGMLTVHPRLAEKVDRIFTTQRDWKDKLDETKNENFDVLKLYTSKKGHEHIFTVINGIFRKDDAVLSEEKIRCAVFLVELINIDLYNYCLKVPSKHNFTGTVYRGMGVSREVMETYEALLKQPIPNRYISIPLALSSASTDEKIARDFITYDIKSTNQKGEKVPLLMKIHVIELNPEYLKRYRETYPTIVVSTICAVCIEDLSHYGGECDVLLRGPFLQVLELYEDRKRCRNPCRVLETVMLNSNRDHKSTAFLGELDAPARKMFGAMVGATRSRFAMRHCLKKNLNKDAEEYKKILETNESELQQM